MSDVSKTNEDLIAEARQCHQARGWSKDPLVNKLENLANRLANALEAATRERDAVVAAKVWDEGYWQGINGHTGPGNPYRDSGAAEYRKAVQS